MLVVGLENLVQDVFEGLAKFHCIKGCNWLCVAIDAHKKV